MNKEGVFFSFSVAEKKNNGRVPSLFWPPTKQKHNQISSWEKEDVVNSTPLLLFVGNGYLM